MHRLKNGSKVVGTKQTLRALEKNTVEVLYVAEDAQQQVVIRAVELAKSQQIPIVYVESMESLKNACDIEVKTATAALIK